MAAINDYHKSKEVQSEFWKINNSIKDWLISHNINDWLNINDEAKSKHINTLIDEILQLCGYQENEDYTFTSSADYAYDFIRYLASYKELIVKLIISEQQADKGTYRIYRGENDKDPAKPETNSYSFSDGLFAGIVRDLKTGSAFYFACLRHNLIFVDLPKKQLLEMSFTEVPVIIPPVIYLGTLLGCGELHHIRTKLIGTKFDKHNGFWFDKDELANEDIKLFSSAENLEISQNIRTFLQLLKRPDGEQPLYRLGHLKVFGWNISYRKR